MSGDSTTHIITPPEVDPAMSAAMRLRTELRAMRDKVEDLERVESNMAAAIDRLTMALARCSAALQASSTIDAAHAACCAQALGDAQAAMNGKDGCSGQSQNQRLRDALVECIETMDTAAIWNVNPAYGSAFERAILNARRALRG